MLAATAVVDVAKNIALVVVAAFISVQTTIDKALVVGLVGTIVVRVTGLSMEWRRLWWRIGFW